MCKEILKNDCVQCVNKDFAYDGVICSNCEREQRQNDFNDGLITITKDNIHLYYEFMSDEDKIKYIDIVDAATIQRTLAIQDLLDITTETMHKDKLAIKMTKFNSSFFHKELSYVSIFGIRDILKPIDEYIADIKASSEYKEYIAVKRDAKIEVSLLCEDEKQAKALFWELEQKGFRMFRNQSMEKTKINDSIKHGIVYYLNKDGSVTWNHKGQHKGALVIYDENVLIPHALELA